MMEAKAVLREFPFVSLDHFVLPPKTLGPDSKIMVSSLFFLTSPILKVHPPTLLVRQHPRTEGRENSISKVF